jgi:hypothetical protein
MLPSEAFHVTAFEVAPTTVAVKCNVPFGLAVAVLGEMTTEPAASAGGAVTVTETHADFVGSATLVALIVWVPGLGAV